MHSTVSLPTLYDCGAINFAGHFLSQNAELLKKRIDGEPLYFAMEHLRYLRLSNTRSISSLSLGPSFLLDNVLNLNHQITVNKNTFCLRIRKIWVFENIVQARFNFYRTQRLSLGI
jgi:hypothetical protein